MKVLEEINDFTYNKLGSLLFEFVPEYKIELDSEENKDQLVVGNYLFMNDFALRLADELNVNTSSNFVINSFKYINEIGESKNLEVLNILKVGIFEILYTSGVEIRKKSNDLLTEKNKECFSSFSKYYN